MAHAVMPHAAMALRHGHGRAAGIWAVAVCTPITPNAAATASLIALFMKMFSGLNGGYHKDGAPP